VSHFESVIVQWNKLNLLSTAIYISKQVCIGWHGTGAYYTAKLIFFHDFPVKLWGCILYKCAYYIHIFTELTP